MLDLTAERGYNDVTIEMLTERAGVSRADFDHHFTGKDDCHLQIFWENSIGFDRQVHGAFEAESEWPDALRASAYAAARYIRDHPRNVAYGVTLMFSAGDLAQAYRDEQLQPLVDLIDAGRQELDDPDSMTRAVAEATIGSFYQLLISQLESGEGLGSAESLVPELMFLAVRPYLGDEVAREELAIPPPKHFFEDPA
jgi:AcrR family transcriptional regulator